MVNSKIYFQILKCITVVCMAFLIIVWQPNIAVAANFSLSCERLDYHEDITILNADCQNGNGGFIPNIFDLNDGIANLNGFLAWHQNGGYGITCNACELDIVNNHIPYLDCTCINDNALGQNTTLNLDERISNIQGHLVFDEE
jgi:hypothetical protein